VLCIPGLSVLDEAVALMATQLVERQADALSMSRIFSLDTQQLIGTRTLATYTGLRVWRNVHDEVVAGPTI
jgi:hypothetical protein